MNKLCRISECVNLNEFDEDTRRTVYSLMESAGVYTFDAYDADDVDKGIKKLEAAIPRWIQVTPSTLPAELKSVYCNTPNGVCTGYIMNGRWFTPNGTIVTDWMEMPTPPTRNSI